MELTNVVINATSVPSSSPISVVLTSFFNVKNFQIFCPQGLTVVNVSTTVEQQLYCEKQCSTDVYTFQTGTAVINGNKHYINSPYNITYNKSNVHCKVCPLGANCTGSIKALPIYWGYKDSKDGSVTMIRCPNGYFCEGIKSCNQINSCNKNRTGKLCGKCQNGLSEALFSADCFPGDTCTGITALFYYTVCVTIYILFLGTYKDLQKLLTAKITELYKRIKDQLCFKKKSNSNSTRDNTDDKIRKREKFYKKSEKHAPYEANKVTDKADDNTKYMQILFFYIQDATLFKINVPGISTDKKAVITKIMSFSPEILTLIYTKVIHICISYAKTPVSKVIFEMLFGLYLIIIISLLYLIQKTISKISQKDFQFLVKSQVLFAESISSWCLIFLSESCNGSFYPSQMCRCCKHYSLTHSG